MIAFFSSRSIRQKLFIIIVLISGAAVMTASAIFALNDRFATRRALSYVVSSQAVIVAQNSTAALAFMDTDAATEVLTGFKDQAHIIHAGIYDIDQQLFTEFTQWPQVTSTLSKSLKVVKDNPSEVYLELFEPIVVDDEIIGTLYVKADLDQFGITFGSYSRVIIFVLLGSLIITWLLARGLHRVITEPVGHIVDVARVITKNNNYSIRALKYHNDELGELVDGINSMLRQIQKRDDQLAEQREELENRVLIRTRELEQLSEEFKFLAYHDTLTNLPNRTFFIDLLNDGIKHASKSGQKLAVLFLDLDRFKNINDSLGHAAGDELLVLVTERVKEAVGSKNTVARFGGDEFTILINQLDSTDELNGIAERLIAAVRRPMDIKGHQLQISVSLGISLYPDDGDESEVLMKNADTAMYSAKEEGRNTFRFYKASMHNAATRQMRIEQNLLKALKEKE